MLALSNTCAMADVLHDAVSRFDRLYKRKAHLHHFTQYIEAGSLASAREAVRRAADEYSAMRQPPPPSDEARALLERLRGAPT